MGCWNETCMLTELPIYAGERVYAFLGIVTPGEFAPIPIPIQGEYDDYGGLENIHETIGTDLLVKYFNEKMYHDDKGLEDCDILGYKDPRKEQLNLDDLLSLVQRGGMVKVKDFEDWRVRNDPANVEMVMIRASALNSALYNWSFKPSYKPEDYKHDNYLDAINNSKAYIQDKMNNVFDNPAIRKITSYSEAKSLHNYSIALASFDSMEMSPCKIIDCPKILVNMINEGEDIDTAVSFLNDMLLYSWFTTFLYWSRKSWRTTGGKGSQMMLTNAQVLFGKILNQEINTMYKKMCELDDDYDDELFSFSVLEG